MARTEKLEGIAQCHPLQKLHGTRNGAYTFCRIELPVASDASIDVAARKLHEAVASAALPSVYSSAASTCNPGIYFLCVNDLGNFHYDPEFILSTETLAAGSPITICAVFRANDDGWTSRFDPFYTVEKLERLGLEGNRFYFRVTTIVQTHAEVEASADRMGDAICYKDTGEASFFFYGSTKEKKSYWQKDTAPNLYFLDFDT